MFRKILVEVLGALIAGVVITSIGFGFYINRCVATNQTKIDRLERTVEMLSTVPDTLRRIDIRTRVMAERLGVDVDKLEGK